MKGGVSPKQMRHRALMSRLALFLLRTRIKKTSMVSPLPSSSPHASEWSSLDRMVRYHRRRARAPATPHAATILLCATLAVLGLLAVFW